MAKKRPTRGKRPTATVWDRTRGWLFFQVKDPVAAAQRVSSLFCGGGREFVVIRADVVRGSAFNLVVPVDAATRAWRTALAEVQKAVEERAAMTARVIDYHPTIPHQAHCFVTKREHKGFPLPEYYPPGRHPNSPGANPWG